MLFADRKGAPPVARRRDDDTLCSHRTVRSDWHMTRARLQKALFQIRNTPTFPPSQTTGFHLIRAARAAPLPLRKIWLTAVVWGVKCGPRSNIFYRKAALWPVLQRTTSCAWGRHNMPPPLQVDLWPFDLESGFRVTCDVATYLV